MACGIRQRWLFFLEPICLIIAFLLQLFVSISLPIFKPVDLFALHITDSSTVANQGEIRFGLWGFCFLNEEDTGIWDYGVCTSPKVGYSIDPSITSTLGLTTSVFDIITDAFTGFLVIHPIIAALTLISLIPGLFTFSRIGRLTSLTLNILAAILSTVVTGVDLAIIIVARSKLQTVLVDAGATSLGLQFSILFGNAPWLSLVAVFFLWIAVFSGSIVVCTCCCCCNNNDDIEPDQSDSSLEAGEETAAEAAVDGEIAEEEAEEQEQEKHWWRRRKRWGRRRGEKGTERY